MRSSEASSASTSSRDCRGLYAAIILVLILAGIGLVAVGVFIAYRGDLAAGILSVAGGFALASLGGDLTRRF